MAVIYLKHPVHGSKVAIAELEAAYDETHGWVRYDPNEKPVVPEKPTVKPKPTPPASVLSAIKKVS